jgi:hypothetical protein
LVNLAGHEQDFDGKALVEIIDAFAAALMKHLNNEIRAILDLRKLGKEKFAIKAWTGAVQKGIGTLRGSDFVTMFPFGFVAHDVTYENGMHKDFPSIPWLMKILIKVRGELLEWGLVEICALIDQVRSTPKKLYVAADK